VLLQHPAADVLVNYIADVLARDDDPAAQDLAALAIHNLSICAATREPRDDDRYKGDKDDDKDDELEEVSSADKAAREKEAAEAAAPMLSIIHHARCEEIMRSLLRMTERAIPHNAAAAATTAAAASAAAAAAAARDAAGAEVIEEDTEDTRDAGEEEEEEEDEEEEEEEEEQPHNCRGALGRGSRSSTSRLNVSA
jgi:hypothetical protein